MTGVFKPRLETLPPAQQRLWPELRQAAVLGFCLYGGTAIALRLGHRASVDFDFFSEQPLDREVLKSAFPFMVQATILQDKPDSLTILVPSKNAQPELVKVSFFGTVGFGRVGEPEVTEDGVMQVASLDDLMATKLKVILQRVEAKDYRDISALISAGVNLNKGLAAAREMFGPNFQPAESLKALVFFQGGDLDTLTNSEKSTMVKAASEVRDLPAVKILTHQLNATSPIIKPTSHEARHGKDSDVER